MGYNEITIVTRYNDQMNTPTLNFNIKSYELNKSLAKNVISVKSCKIQKILSSAYLYAVNKDTSRIHKYPVKIARSKKI